MATTLGLRHVDTGAMFRAVSWKAVHDQLPLDDDAAVARIASQAAIDVEGGIVRIDGHDVTRAIRTPEVDAAASAVAKLPTVRSLLVARQRAYGAGGVVMEGRDIGTVVFPDADVKIYLDASAEERARRRTADAGHSGGASGAAEVARAMAERDKADSTRAVAPLTLAPDAVYVDTTTLSINDVVERVMALVAQAARR